MIHIKQDVMYTQAYGCWLCLHVGSNAIFFGRRKGYGVRLELFTPIRKWRLSWGEALSIRMGNRQVDLTIQKARKAQRVTD